MLTINPTILSAQKVQVLECTLQTNGVLEYFNIHLVGIIYFLTADITLTSSLDGAQAACPGQVVTYTCTALHTKAICGLLHQAF